MKPNEVPVNLWSADASPEAITRDVDHAFFVFGTYRKWVRAQEQSFLGRRLLEIGPGHSLGTGLLLASSGAAVTVADRYLVPWDAGYHPRFFRALLRRMRCEGPEAFDPDPVIRLLIADGFTSEVLTRIPVGTEELGSYEDLEPFDIVLSNAVLEHVADAEAAARALASVTREGGLHLHQIDFRDHRDQDRPLEFLTMSSEDFAEEFELRSGECGNRVGPEAWQAQFETAGFQVAEFEPNIFATDEYLADLRMRLHDDFLELSDEQLRVVSGMLVLRRDSRTYTEHPTESDSPQTLAHCRARYAFVEPLAKGRRVLDVGCGAGIGTRQLWAAGPATLEGIDVDPAALQQARQAGPAGAITYNRLDLEEGALGYPAGSFDLVVCLEVLEHVERQADLITEIERVLSADGVAVISVPHAPFEAFWTRLNNEPNPFHHHVPGVQEFRGMLGVFPQVELFAQADLISSVVLPLRGEPLRRPIVVEGPSCAQLEDRGTITILAVCTKGAFVPASGSARGVGYGDHQVELGGAKLYAAEISARSAVLASEAFRAHNCQKWSNLGFRETLLGPRNVLTRVAREGVQAEIRRVWAASRSWWQGRRGASFG